LKSNVLIIFTIRKEIFTSTTRTWRRTLYIAFVIYLYYERVWEHGTVDIVMKRKRRLRQTLYILFVTYLCYESVTEDGIGDRNEE